MKFYINNHLNLVINSKNILSNIKISFILELINKKIFSKKLNAKIKKIIIFYTQIYLCKNK